MDPTVAALNLTKAAAIIANMIESYLAGGAPLPTGKEPIMMNSKMADHHLARQACIYIRQSTPGQVRFNQESKERQYNLARTKRRHWAGCRSRSESSTAISATQESRRPIATTSRL